MTSYLSADNPYLRNELCTSTAALVICSCTWLGKRKMVANVKSSFLFRTSVHFHQNALYRSIPKSHYSASTSISPLNTTPNNLIIATPSLLLQNIAIPCLPTQPLEIETLCYEPSQPKQNVRSSTTIILTSFTTINPSPTPRSQHIYSTFCAPSSSLRIQQMDFFV